MMKMCEANTFWGRRRFIMSSRKRKWVVLGLVLGSACVTTKRVKTSEKYQLPTKFLRHHSSNTSQQNTKSEETSKTPYLDYAISVLGGLSSQRERISSVIDNVAMRKVLHSSSQFVDKVSPLYYISQNLLQLYKEGRTINPETLVGLGLNISWAIGVYGWYSVPGLDSAYMGYSAYTMYPVVFDIAEKYFYGEPLTGPKMEIPMSELADPTCLTGALSFVRNMRPRPKGKPSSRIGRD